MKMFTQNKYLKLYNLIIENAKNRILNKNIYFESHHIIPKSLKGTNDLSNLVKLTAREHYIVHQLLPKFTKGKDKSKMIWAFKCLNEMPNNGIKQRYINSKTYERYRIIFSESISGKNNPMFGISMKQRLINKHGKINGLIKLKIWKHNNLIGNIKANKDITKREKARKSMIEAHKDGTLGKRISKTLRITNKNPEVQLKRKLAAKESSNRPEVKQKHSENSKRMWIENREHLMKNRITKEFKDKISGINSCHKIRAHKKYKQLFNLKETQDLKLFLEKKILKGFNCLEFKENYNIDTSKLRGIICSVFLLPKIKGVTMEQFIINKKQELIANK